MGPRMFGRYFFCTSLVSLFFFYVHPLQPVAQEYRFVAIVLLLAIGALLLAFPVWKNVHMYLMLAVIALGMAFGIFLNWLAVYNDVFIAGLFGGVMLVSCAVLAFAIWWERTHRVPLPVLKSLFQEREYDLERLRQYLLDHEPDQTGLPSAIGLTGAWGDGKSFLVEHLLRDPTIKRAFHVIRINALVFHFCAYADALLDQVSRILQSEGIFSTSLLSLREAITDGKILRNVYDWFSPTPHDTPSLFQIIERDVQKLDRRILLVVEDIDRIPKENSAVLDQIFAISEEVARHSGGKFRILYLYDEEKMEQFDTSVGKMSKYVAHTVPLTPLPYQRLLSYWSEEAGALLEPIERSLHTCDGLSALSRLRPHKGANGSVLTRTEAQAYLLKQQTARRVREFYSELQRMQGRILYGKTGEEEKLAADVTVAFYFTKYFLPHAFEALGQDGTLRERLPVAGGWDVPQVPCDDCRAIDIFFCFFLFHLQEYTSLLKSKDMKIPPKLQDLIYQYDHVEAWVDELLHADVPEDAVESLIRHVVQKLKQRNRSEAVTSVTPDDSTRTTILWQVAERMRDVESILFLFHSRQACAETYDIFFRFYFERENYQETEVFSDFGRAFRQMTPRALLFFSDVFADRGIHRNYKEWIAYQAFCKNYLRAIDSNLLGGEHLWQMANARRKEDDSMKLDDLLECTRAIVITLQKDCDRVEKRADVHRQILPKETYQPIVRMLTQLIDAQKNAPYAPAEEKSVKYQNANKHPMDVEEQIEALQEMKMHLEGDTSNYNRIANAIRNLVQE